MPDLRLERSAGVAVLTIDRPQARNAIALTTMDEFDAALDELEAGDQRVVVLTGAGDRAFIAGGDVKQLEAVMPAWGGIERLAALVGRARALYLLTSGHLLTAADAFDCGLVERVWPSTGFEAAWRELAERMAAAPREALVAIKAAVEAVEPNRRPDLAPAATRAFARLWADPAHWEAAARQDRNRRAARGRAEG